MNKRSSNFKIFVSPTGWLEVHDLTNQETYLQSFYNLKSVTQGDGYLVVQLNSGRIETYDQQLNILSHRVFKNVAEIQATKKIEIVLKNGDRKYFDKYLEPQVA